MRYIEIIALNNGAHRNISIDGVMDKPDDGWAIIPEEIVIPDTFPFVDIEVSENVVTKISPRNMNYSSETLSTEQTAEEILLELAADHEARICAIELGV